MVQILSIALMNKPGNLARVSTELASAGINIEAWVGDSQAEMGVARLMVDDPERARDVLKEAGHPVQLIPGVKVGLDNQPGQLATLLRTLGQAGINVDLIFGSTGGAQHGEAILFCDDPAKARKVLDAE